MDTCLIDHCKSTSTESGGPWRSLLEGEVAQRAMDTAEKIVGAIRGRPNADPTLAQGAAGHALLHAYRGAATQAEDESDAASRELHRAIEAVASTAMTPSLFGGFLGVAWARSEER